MSVIATVYRSTDAGAPVLSGQPGALAAVLDACLVDGYGDKAPLGWLRAFSDGHKRVYRNDQALGASGFFIRFDDSGTIYCNVTAYESMSSVDAGVNIFSATPSQWYKSATANSLAREWTIIGTDRCCYLFMGPNGGHVDTAYTGWFFGDLLPFGPTDVWAFAYSGHRAQSTYRFSSLLMAVGAASDGGMYAARSYDGSAIGKWITNRAMMVSNQTYFGAVGGLPYPYPITNGMVLSNITVVEGSLFRAKMPGVWVAEHNSIIEDGVVYSDILGMPEGTELLCKAAYPVATATQRSRALWDLTNPWY